MKPNNVTAAASAGRHPALRSRDEIGVRARANSAATASGTTTTSS
jgi:hypothetical protein